MKGSHILAATASLAALALPLAALGTTLNFGSLSQAGSSFSSIGSSYTENGFTVSSASLIAWQASSANLPGLAPANTSLMAFNAGAVTTIAAVGNSPFSMNSIGLAPFLTGGSGSFVVTFVGLLSNSTTVTQNCTVNDGTPPALQTCTLSGFNNLVSVSFDQGTNTGYLSGQDTAYQFDNVVLNGSSAVPEPATLTLLGLGLAGLGFARRRKSS